MSELSKEGQAPKLGAIAWYEANSGDQTHPVGHKTANPYGLYDMLGNVWEWCEDDASHGLRTYGALPEIDPVATGEDLTRVIRGASWNTGALGVRTAYRDAVPRRLRRDIIGFRLAGGQVSDHR